MISWLIDLDSSHYQALVRNLNQIGLSQVVSEASKMVGAFDNVDEPNDEIELFLDVHCSEDKRTVCMIVGHGC